MAMAKARRAGNMNDPRKKIEADLRSLADQADVARRKAKSLQSEVYLLTYSWVEWSITNGKHRHINDACRALGKIIKRPTGCVSQWFYLGRFMRMNHIRKGVLASSVYVAYRYWPSLTPHVLTRSITMMHAGETGAEVSKYIRANAAVRADAFERRLARLAANGKLTDAYVRERLDEMRQIADAWYGPKCRAVIYHGGTRLMEAKP